MTTALSRAQTGVVIWPANITASNNRIVRRGWQASIAPRAAMRREGGSTPADVLVKCPHSHKSVTAAQKCGTAIWKRLP